jgi:PAS domain S-box-containing protein/putative nucleotidyltransferase with HDIG domain
MAQRILVVDDREDNLYLLRALLEGHGYEVVTAADGVEALETARREPPRLVVSDILMPGMDGFALCREWKKDEVLTRIPFVFYTATYTDERDREFALGLGAERFIVKPAEPDAFLAVIEEAVRVAGPAPVARGRAGREVRQDPGAEADAASVEDGEYLKSYNAALVRKLEAKMQQLEQVNRRLEGDIAARREAEEALRRSEERYRGYVDNAPYGVFIADDRGRYVEANRGAVALTGYELDELTAMTIEDVIEPGSRGWGREHFSRLVETGSATGIGLFRRKDGSVFHGRVDAVRLSADRLLGFLVDVTDQIRDADQVRSQAALIDLAHDAIMVLDMDDRLVFWSRGAEETYGWSAGEAVGQVAHSLLKTEFPEPRPALMQALGTTGQWEGELVHTTKNGRSITVTSRWSLKRDDSGAAEAVLEINRDITLQVRTLADLAQSAEHLRHALSGAIAALGTTVEQRDPYTAGHQRRVAELACAIAVELGWDDDSVETLRMAALLHDIGKIIVPAEILTKPGTLGDIEMQLVRGHPAAGADTVAKIDFGGSIAEVVRQHHERLDGSGYPLGLSGSDILPQARVLAIADVVEAMISHRPYRPALPVRAALDEIGSGPDDGRYDRDAAEACRALFEDKGYVLLE